MRRFMMGAALGAASLLPGWALAGDQETAQHVAANMKNSGRLKGYSIDVKAKDGLVVLMGKVASDDQLKAAIEVAQQTPEVEQVVSQLSIAAPATALPQARTEGGLRQPPAIVSSNEEIPQLTTTESSGRRRQPAAIQPQVQAAVASSYDAEPAQKPVPRSIQVSSRMNAPMPLQAGQAAPIQPQSPPPVPVAAVASRQPSQMPYEGGGAPSPAYAPGVGGGPAAVRYDHAQMPN